MTTLDLIPHLSGGAWMILLFLFAGAVLLAVGVVGLEHLATNYQADQYEAGQSPMEGQLTRRRLDSRVPQQRRPEDGGVS